MSKLDRIVMLLDLLHHRQKVSMSTITKLCEVTERTAYRYIGTLSRANIPVYYDKDAEGYRLASMDDVSFNNVSIGEACLVIAALELLSVHVNEAYRADLDRLVRKIISEKDFPLEEFLLSWRNMDITIKGTEDLSDQLTAQLIHLAIRYKRKVNLSTATAAKDETSTVLREPVLRFKGRWEIAASESHDESQEAISLSEIKKAEIL